jgi:hemicentin
MLSFFILVPPVSNFTSTNQTYSQGDTAMLECTSMGGPNNTYQWQANGTNLDNETLPILMIFQITAENGGEYTCVVSNLAGSHNTSTFLFVYPYFLSHPGDVEVSLGSIILLTCDAVGFPSPEYTWQRADGMSIMSDSDIDGRVLNTTVEFGDEGEYYCIALGRGLSIQSQNAIVTGIWLGHIYIIIPVNDERMNDDVCIHE